MYYAYGWPKVFKNGLERRPPAQRREVALLRCTRDTEPGGALAGSGGAMGGGASTARSMEVFFYVSETAVQIWASQQQRVKLGEYRRAADDVGVQGETVAAFVHPGGSALALLTSAGYVLIYDVRESATPTAENHGGGDDGGDDGNSSRSSNRERGSRRTGVSSSELLPPGLQYARLVTRCVVLANDEFGFCTAVTGDTHCLLLGRSDGRLQALSWKGQLRRVSNPLTATHYHASGVGTSTLTTPASSPWRTTSAASPQSAYHPRSPSIIESPGLDLHLSSQQQQQHGATAAGGSSATSSVDGHDHQHSTLPAIVGMEYAAPCRHLVLLTEEKSVAICAVGDKGLRVHKEIAFSRWLAISEVSCIHLGARTHALAIGCRNGDVEVYNLMDGGKYERTISLCDWGFTVGDTGFVSCLQWSPDERVLAVGWEQRGISVWSHSGCRLMCSLRQAGLSLPQMPNKWTQANHHHSAAGSPSMSTPLGTPTAGAGYGEMMEGGVACLMWGPEGYYLLAVDHKQPHRFCQFGFAKGCKEATRSSMLQWIQADDRLLLVRGGEQGPQLTLRHVVLPQSFIALNWPVRHVASSDDGLDLAISGRNGVILHNLRSHKWRVFGDIRQEKEIRCRALTWFGKIIIICNERSNGAFELLLYPRFHLDERSLLLRKPLGEPPMAMDASGDFILMATPPMDLTMYRIEIQGELSPTSLPQVQLVPVRELSIMTARQPPIATPILSCWPGDTDGSGPSQCMVLRADGSLSQLDLDKGSERPVATGIERLWLSSNHRATRSGSGKSQHKAGAAVSGGSRSEDRPWWTYFNNILWLYSATGMQVYFPPAELSHHHTADSTGHGRHKLQLEAELEFDREVYPIGVSDSGLIVGVSQRLVTLPSLHFHLYEPIPKAQPILPCLLRNLLMMQKEQEALALAKASQLRPYFAHSLEWLLFTVLDADFTLRSENRKARRRAQEARRLSGPGDNGDGGNGQHPKSQNGAAPLSAREREEGVLLGRTATLLRQFPQFLDIVVSVARKTDGSRWPALFEAVGGPSDLFEACFERQQYRSAACYILVIEKLDGAGIGQQHTVRLLDVTLAAGEYDLAGELVRFLVHAGRDGSSCSVPESPIASASKSAANNGPEDGGEVRMGGLAALFARLGVAGQTPQEKEQRDKAAQLARQQRRLQRQQELEERLAREDEELQRRVEEMMREHACALLRRGDLRELVEFTKGTHFDLPAFLAAEREQSARLQDFRSALSEARRKLDAGANLHAKLDAEYLLAHFRAVGCTEWVVVLATLLQRTQLLLELFETDKDLWQAYRRSLQQQEGGVYAELLSKLEEQLGID